MQGRSSPENVSTKLQRIAQLARQSPQMVLTTLAHHIDVDLLREAYRRTRKDGAPGVDGVTGEQYETGLEKRLEDLLIRFKSGTYRAPPVRRTYIPKGDGKKMRPLGIPTFEDKVLQRAVAMVLEAVYEQDFLEGSYGFRPGRSAHQALDALRDALMSMNGGWVLEVDIQSFFDRVGHSHLRGFLDQRVRDGVLRRAIDKWLKAGIMEEGTTHYPDEGTPQGGVISPLLANVYLHETMDKWFEQQVKPRLRGRSVMIRYADDIVVAFEREDDARRVFEVLPRRFGKYGLALHPEKTRLVEFRRPRGVRRTKSPKDAQSRSFDLLGFRHYWGKSLKGAWVVKKKTAPSRFARGLKRIKDWCRKHRHYEVREQHETLTLKLRGHYSYFGVSGNGEALKRFLNGVTLIWHKWLNRRNLRNPMPWERFERLLKRYPLPPPKVVHSIYAAQRIRGPTSRMR